MNIYSHNRQNSGNVSGTNSHLLTIEKEWCIIYGNGNEFHK